MPNKIWASVHISEYIVIPFNFYELHHLISSLPEGEIDIVNLKIWIKNWSGYKRSAFLESANSGEKEFFVLTPTIQCYITKYLGSATQKTDFIAKRIEILLGANSYQ